MSTFSDKLKKQQEKKAKKAEISKRKSANMEDIKAFATSKGKKVQEAPITVEKTGKKGSKKKPWELAHEQFAKVYGQDRLDKFMNRA